MNLLLKLCFVHSILPGNQAKVHFPLKRLEYSVVGSYFRFVEASSMPELKIISHRPSWKDSWTLYDADAIAYTDKTREKQRQAALEKQREQKSEKKSIANATRNAKIMWPGRNKSS